jgi:hypothetical protein
MSIIEKPPLAGDGLSELCQAGSFDNSDVKRSRQKPQIKYQGPAEAAFETEIALALAALTLAHGRAFSQSHCQVRGGRRLSQPRSYRRRAREQFLSSKKHGPPPRHGSGPRRFEISSQLIADAEQPETRA